MHHEKFKTREWICHMLENYDIKKVKIDTEFHTDIFTSHMLYIISKHRRRHGYLTDRYVEKLRKCIDQINNSTKHKRYERTYIVYEEENFLAFLRRKPPVEGEGMYSLSLVLERISGQWHIASEESTQIVKEKTLAIY